MESLIKIIGIVGVSFFVDIAMLPVGKSLMEKNEPSILMMFVRITPLTVAVILTIMAF